MKNSTIITEIDGQGQKIAAVVLEFGESIKPVDMQPDNYAVENQTVKELLVCSVPEWEKLFRQQLPAEKWAEELYKSTPERQPAGNCVILILDKNRPEASVKRMTGRGPGGW